MVDVGVFTGIASAIIIAVIGYVTQVSALFEKSKALPAAKWLVRISLSGLLLLPLCQIIQWSELKITERIITGILAVFTIMLVIYLRQFIKGLLDINWQTKKVSKELPSAKELFE